MKREISLYLVFGVFTTLIGVGGYGLLLKTGFHYFTATTLSWLLAVLFAFITNRKYVFESEVRSTGGILKEGSVFFISRLSTWVMETMGLMLLIESLYMDQMVSKYIMSVLVIVMNYVLSKIYVFQSNTEAE